MGNAEQIVRSIVRKKRAIANTTRIGNSCGKRAYLPATRTDMKSPKINASKYGIKPLIEGSMPNIKGVSVNINIKKIPQISFLFDNNLSSKKKKDISTSAERGKVSAKSVRRLGAPCQSMLPTAVSTTSGGNIWIIKFLM